MRTSKRTQSQIHRTYRPQIHIKMKKLGRNLIVYTCMSIRKKSCQNRVTIVKFYQIKPALIYLVIFVHIFFIYLNTIYFISFSKQLKK